MTQHIFLRQKLVGKRFETRAIPLDFLKDLSVLEELIVEVAKSEFLKDHADRQRSPRGFTDDISLKLTDIEDGSSVAVIAMFVAANTLFPPDNQVYFERARDAYVNAIVAVEGNGRATDYLPEKTLSYFDRIGCGLRDDEAMEYSVPERNGVARLTRETRRKLALSSSRANEIAEETSVRGMIPEADQDNMTFQLQLFDGRKVKAPIAEQHSDKILEAFNGYKKCVCVALQGIGRFNRSDKLQAFDSIEHVSLLDPLDVLARLDAFRTLKDGWLEGQGFALSHAGIDWFSRMFSQAYPDHLPLPYTYPTPDGGIRLEWALNHIESSLEVDLTTRSAYWHELDVNSDAEHERHLLLEQIDDWRWIAQRIEQLKGCAA